MSDLSLGSDTWRGAAAQQLRVIGALMLRDMRTRFGGTHLTYIIAIMWPLSHLTFIFVLNVYLRRAVVGGAGSSPVFIASGLLPYILCFYPARMILLSVESNKLLLYFPIVKTTDILVARTVVEILSALLVTVIFCLGLYVADIDFWPVNPGDAVEAILAAIFLGAGLGVFNTAMFSIFKMAAMLTFVLMMLFLYTTSGVFVPISTLPPDIQYYLSYNPLAQLVEWLRSAYYVGYSAPILSKSYVLLLAGSCLFLGLVMDRVFRGRLMVQ